MYAKDIEAIPLVHYAASHPTGVLDPQLHPVATTEGKDKVKCALVQALSLCTGRAAHRGSRGIALPIHDHSTRRG